MHRKSILIVDDEAAQRQVFARYLEFTGYRVIEAPNGEEGVRMAREHAPGLILLDLAMPVMDGWETMSRLGNDPATAAIPVIALTGLDLGMDQIRDAGFCAYLQKPLVPFLVLEEVESCIGSRKTLAGDRPRSWSDSRGT